MPINAKKTSALEKANWVFAQPVKNGVTELVDVLLNACAKNGLELECKTEQWRVRFVGDGWENFAGVPVSQSVFRAMLARLAVLCNESVPKALSLYGGRGTLTVIADRPTELAIQFTNTAEKQELLLTAKVVESQS